MSRKPQRPSRPQCPPPEPSRAESALVDVLISLIDAVTDLKDVSQAQTAWFRSHVECATKSDLKQMERRMAEQITNLSAAVKAAFARIHTALDGLTADVTQLTAKIAELQNSPGAITAEDQALLDEIQTGATGIADRLEALDAATPAAA